jgi:competence protein ComEA
VEPLSRPEPSEALARRAVAWIGWFGVGRLVAASVATVIVCGGAFWLVRSPPPPTEASLPVATTSTAPPGASSVPPSPPSAAVLVHVAGSVVAPGVYELLPGARVRDAVVAAGGPTEGADQDALNLAAPVVDGTRIYVPAVGEDLPDLLDLGAGPMSVPPGPIDVNRATASELEELPGVGPATASAIVTERERNGPFASVDELERVPGIGPAKLDALRGLVTT